MVVTRCPNCHARFRVSDGQLKLAAGQVRCGACLLVFDARQHSLTQSPRPVAQAAPEPTAAQTPVQAPVQTPIQKAAPQPDAKPTEAKQSQPKPMAPPSPTPKVTPPTSESPESSTSVEPRASASLRQTSTVEQPRTQAVQTPVSKQDSEQTTEQNSSTPVDVLGDFRAEALQLSHPADDDPNPVSTTGWLLLCFLAVLGLGAQLIWFERAQLARYPQLGSLYALLCDQVDCSLQRPALELIRNHNLLLQPHPQYLDALSATILLENEAPFEQPWPALNLRFTDLKGRLVAQRTFQPSEYLDAGAMDPKHMPPGRSLQVNLELATPGRRGTSYELELVAPL